MSEKPTSDRIARRKVWDAEYRERNRERRRAYDRERMRRLRAEKKADE